MLSPEIWTVAQVKKKEKKKKWVDIEVDEKKGMTEQKKKKEPRGGQTSI